MYSRPKPSGEAPLLLLGAIVIVLLASGAVASGAAAGPSGSTNGSLAPSTAGDDPTDLTAVTAQDQEPLVESCAAEMPDDYADPDGGAAGTIGWVDGYWYDEPIDVDATDGLSESELEVLTARTAARAEALRCLTYEDGVPPVEVVSRDELANETGERFANVSEDARRFDNAVLSTLLMVGETNDSVGVREESQSQTVAGYYSIEEDRIVVVERPGKGSAVDETVLTHEVAHALQDQNFGIDRSSNVTMDRDNGLLGLVEGDASWVEHRYLQRCENDRWAEPCVTLGDDEEGAPGGDGSGSTGEGSGQASSAPPNWGLYLEQYQPYSDGPTFVRSIYRDGGWDAVDALYEDPPESALYVMSPDTYGSAELVEPTIADARGDWERLEIEGAPDYETVGPAGIGGMVIAPTYETDGTEGVVSPLEFLNYDANNELSELDPLVYEQEPVDGWRGDRMAVFERDDETATVWRSAWANGDEAEEFAEAYRDILAIHEANTTDGSDDVYTFGEASDHEGAVAVIVEDEEVLIVTAPSPTALETVSPATTDASDDGADDSDELPVPGFGVVGALLAFVLAVGWLSRR